MTSSGRHALARVTKLVSGPASHAAYVYIPTQRRGSTRPEPSQEMGCIIALRPVVPSTDLARNTKAPRLTPQASARNKPASVPIALQNHAILLRLLLARAIAPLRRRSQHSAYSLVKHRLQPFLPGVSDMSCTRSLAFRRAACWRAQALITRGRRLTSWSSPRGT